MPKIVGIGETVYDILFENNHPVNGTPGGSIFNALISLSRLQQQTEFISEIGNDHVGEVIVNFLQQNKVGTSHVVRHNNAKTTLVLAFLDEERKANYTFYKEPFKQEVHRKLPNIQQDDILLFGSFFSLEATIRKQVLHVLQTAHAQQATIYYDINFRKAYASKRVELLPTVIENMQFADIVKGSDEDFAYLYQESDPQKIYNQHIAPHCPIFIYTQGAAGARLFTPTFSFHLPSHIITPISTIGAGDNFNAGVLFGLMQHDRKTLAQLDIEQWKIILQQGIDCATHVCTLYENHLSTEFAKAKIELLS
ncbi:MAG: carbohydrate kinase [Paludibacteraceae bacterium]|nr:carbohydrate kinase [Paludibacteraceae bacterium]MBP6285229.1 carbohydrate kinase [Paludibacteraceae bacterium]